MDSESLLYQSSTQDIKKTVLNKQLLGLATLTVVLPYVVMAAILLLAR